MKKILSLVLVLAMFLSLSAAAMAETGVDTNAVEKNGVQFKGTVKIGSVMCEAGAFAGVGVPYSQFYKLYVKYINEVMGGVAKGADGVGYYLEHISYDDQSEGPLAKTYIEKLIEDDEVFSMVGNLGTWIIAATRTTSWRAACHPCTGAPVPRCSTICPLKATSASPSPYSPSTSPKAASCCCAP